MEQESFHIQFNWQSNQRQLQIKTEKVEGYTPVIAIYQIFYNDTYLFAIYPTFNTDSCKAWEILEKERETKLPPGFVGVLGGIIEEIYVN